MGLLENVRVPIGVEEHVGFLLILFSVFFGGGVDLVNRLGWYRHRELFRFGVSLDSCF